MKSLSNAPSGQSSQFMSSNGGQRIRSCLPILGTAVLVFFLGGGFPPATWMFLFHTLAQLNDILINQGPAAILPLTVLVVQSLLLAVAWGLLGWVALREGAYLMTMQSK